MLTSFNFTCTLWTSMCSMCAKDPLNLFVKFLCWSVPKLVKSFKRSHTFFSISFFEKGDIALIQFDLTRSIEKQFTWSSEWDRLIRALQVVDNCCWCDPSFASCADELWPRWCHVHWPCRCSNQLSIRQLWSSRPVRRTLNKQTQARKMRVKRSYSIPV